MSRLSWALGVIGFVSASAKGVVSYPADDAVHFTWLGRILRGFGNVSGSVVFDLEGTSLLFRVANASFIGLNIIDSTRGGARLGVYFDSESADALVDPTDPNPAGRAIPPTARVATLVTSPQQTLYTLGSGSQIAGLGPAGVLGVRVELITEWSHMGDEPGELFAVGAIVTDGVLQPAPPAPTRRLLVLGDSLSSGPGAGYNVPPTGAPCGDGVLLNDWSGTWNALLCTNFSAACEVIAQSGATITGASYNIPMSLPWALGAMGSADWPVASRMPWSAPVSGVFIELGENDCHLFNCTAPNGRAKLSAAYVALAHTLAASQPAGKALPIWLTLSNHEAGQSVAMGDAVGALQREGFTAVSLLNGTSPGINDCGENIDNGCAGHPSAAQNLLAFARMQPVVAAALGW